jgi:fatty acid desaturase
LLVSSNLETSALPSGAPASSESIAEDAQWLSSMRVEVADLFRPSASVYWLDFLTTLAIGYPCLLAFALMEGVSWQRGVYFAVAVLAVFRAGSFIHEIAHFRHDEMRSFRWFWNAAFGIPLLMPSFFYVSHLGHHNRQKFGTSGDGEYLPLADGKWRSLLEFLIQVPLLPLWVVLRFLLSPVTFLHPRLRKWTLERASSFVINFRARQDLQPSTPLFRWATMELAASVVIWSLMLGLLFDWPMLITPGPIIFLAMGVLTLNYLRTFVAHRYQSQGVAMSFRQQLEDSINVEGHPLLTELIFPVGLRYHALHHLFPTLPYHNLGIAHRRLMAELPEDAPYRGTVFRTLRAALASWWNDFRTAAKRNQDYAS